LFNRDLAGSSRPSLEPTQLPVQRPIGSEADTVSGVEEKVRVKVVRVHSIKSHRGRRDIAPLILSFGAR
jgi:hypothetical protein